MKKILILALMAVSLLSACIVAPANRRGHRQNSVVIVPLLPQIVVLDAEPYYFYSGYHYHYNNGSWYYAQSKNGPWVDLPRDHYPKEVRYKGKEKHRDDRRDRRDRRDDRDDRDDRDRDDRYRDDRRR